MLTAWGMIHATIWCAWHPSCVNTVHPITSYGGIIKISLGFKEYMVYALLCSSISYFPICKNWQLVSDNVIVILKQRTIKFTSNHIRSRNLQSGHIRCTSLYALNHDGCMRPCWVHFCTSQELQNTRCSLHPRMTTWIHGF